jgi:hypothetical protein
VAKDRAAPFSRKHKRYWLPVTGGMVLIGVINTTIGLYLYAHRPKAAPRRAHYDASPFPVLIDAGVPADAQLPDKVER